MKTIEKATFCQCTNCETIMFDQNPQTGAKQYKISDFPNATEMQYMQLLIENQDSDIYWACPICLTDENLIDL